MFYESMYNFIVYRTEFTWSRSVIGYTTNITYHNGGCDYVEEL